MDKVSSNKITITSFILSVLIIIAHSYNVGVYHLTDGFVYWFERIIDSTTEAAVPLFFIISAFLFYIDIDEKGYLYKLKKRIKSLVIPFLVWNVIGFIYYLVLSNFPYIKNYVALDLDIGTFQIIKNILNTEYNKPLWFLQYLIIYTYITPLFKKVLKNKIMSFALLIIVYLTPLFNIFSFNSILIDYIYYLLGAIIACHYKSTFLKRFNKKEIIISILLFVICAWLFIFTDITNNQLLDCLRMIIESISMWIMMDAFIKIVTPKNWMKNTFFSYSIHEMILEPIEKIIFIFLGNNVLGAMFDYVVAPIMTLLIILLLASFLSKNKTIWAILSGSR